MKKVLIALVFIFVAVTMFSSCYSANKCNGAKKTRTPMGYM